MIESKLVSLNPIALADIDLVQKWNFDPQTSEFFPSRSTVTREEQVKWFERQLLSKNKKKTHHY